MMAELNSLVSEVDDANNDDAIALLVEPEEAMTEESAPFSVTLESFEDITEERLAPAVAAELAIIEDNSPSVCEFTEPMIIDAVPFVVEPWLAMTAELNPVVSEVDDAMMLEAAPSAEDVRLESMDERLAFEKEPELAMTPLSSPVASEPKEPMTKETFPLVVEVWLAMIAELKEFVCELKPDTIALKIPLALLSKEEITVDNAPSIVTLELLEEITTDRLAATLEPLLAITPFNSPEVVAPRPPRIKDTIPVAEET